MVVLTRDQEKLATLRADVITYSSQACRENLQHEKRLRTKHWEGNHERLLQRWTASIWENYMFWIILRFRSWLNHRPVKKCGSLESWTTKVIQSAEGKSTGISPCLDDVHFREWRSSDPPCLILGKCFLDIWEELHLRSKIRTIKMTIPNNPDWCLKIGYL